MFRKIVTLLLFSSISAMAQYKCVESGNTVYSDKPCSPNAKVLVLPADTPVSEADRAQARASYYRQRVVADEIDVQNALIQREQNSRMAQQAVAAAAKETRCQQLLASAQDARNRLQTYRYHQGLIDNARREVKEAEDRHFSECYGRNR